MHNSMSYDPIKGQGQDHVTLKVGVIHEELTISPARG